MVEFVLYNGSLKVLVHAALAGSYSLSPWLSINYAFIVRLKKDVLSILTLTRKQNALLASPDRVGILAFVFRAHPTSGC